MNLHIIIPALRFLTVLLVLNVAGVAVAESTVTQNLADLTPQQQEALIAQKQAEVEHASHSPLLRLRIWLADWLPLLTALAVLLVIWKWLLRRCPKCRRRFPKRIAYAVSQRPTPTSSGRAVATYRCRGCGHEWKVEQYLTRNRRRLRTGGSGGPPHSGSSSSSQSSSFGGFGGGSSGGGGTTRGY